jgi:hypothetical protein
MPDWGAGETRFRLIVAALAFTLLKLMIGSPSGMIFFRRRPHKKRRPGFFLRDAFVYPDSAALRRAASSKPASVA